MSKDDPGEDEPRKMLQRMLQQRGYVLDWHKVLAAEDPKFLAALNGLLEAAYMAPRRLDRKTKELAFVAALVGLGAGKEHIKIHVEHAKRAGATKEEVLELLEMLVTPCGVPKFMTGCQVWMESFAVDRLEPLESE